MAEVRSVAKRSGYSDPELFRFAGSMEGLPEWVDPVHTSGAAPWQRNAQEWFAHVAIVLPGVVIAGLLALAGRELADLIGNELLGVGGAPVSPILIAILLGLLIRNAIGLPESYQAGLRLCLQRVLRFGVALLGLHLSLATVGSIGLVALPLVAASIATALLVVSLINRLLGLPARLGTLVAVGTAICGNSAIVATAPAIRAREDEVSYAVGCVTLFGLLALGIHPFLAHSLFDGNALHAGLFLGTAIHDTAQVAGAGLLYRQQFGGAEALDAAMVTKLLRNMFMVLVIPGMALIYHRRGEERASGMRPALRQVVPFFVFGFLGLALLRTLGDLGTEPFGGALDSAVWTRIVETGVAASAWCLTLAMAAVGLGTDLSRLRTLGLRPLAVGFAAAVTVGAVSALLIRGLAPVASGG
ncbi:MAG: putative sulfate exporter family transporter [Myxococcota bacterium]|jgi:uncharacterized integral membrane protein (TIGR00698 family)|nr:putative sulfate exporter family transporter [Deltaproteobacteria bacterium]MCP4245329.1 putative sulfate exporter family transporter [bacterium]MDP6242266.1 putative sulfate exporter family transporter [Myxococcota bacterium]MDP7074427.1 putative sulfate exporter family transporter [Myxococcota bacterium]MDP7300579.1 putative sulfate exporter family transporter [Myxococcota bacterium]